MGRLLNAYDHRFLTRLGGSPLAGPAEVAVMNGVGQLVAAGKTVAVLVDNPPMRPLRSCNGRLTASAVLNRLLDLQQGAHDPDCLVAKTQYRAAAKIYLDMLAAVKARYGDRVLILDYTDFYCRENGGTVCGTSFAGNALYGYTDHISSYTASVLGRLINDRLGAFTENRRGLSPF